MSFLIFKDNIIKSEMNCGGLDEAPFAYKDIEVGDAKPKALADIVGKFTPKIVKMCRAETNRKRKPSKRDVM